MKRFVQKLLTSAVILPLLFCCSSVVAVIIDSSSMSSHEDRTSTDHCATSAASSDGSSDTTAHRIFILQSSLFQKLLTIGYLVVSVVLIMPFFLVSLAGEIFWQYVWIRDRYGGFVLFNPLSILFKTGIIHPKVY